MEPLVSIITPCYNSSDFVRATLNSVIVQDYKNWELIVVDDKSNDDTCKIVEEFTSRYRNIKLISLLKNEGVSNARNIGMLEARGKYIAFLDSDDVWMENKLSRQIAYMEEQLLTMTFCSYKRINEEGAVISRQIPVPFSVSYKNLLSHNMIIFSTSMTLRSAIGDLKFKKAGHEDWIFWLDLFKKSEGGHGINEPLVLYRIRSGSVSSNKLKAIGYTWKILRENEKIGVLRSMYLFSKYVVATVWKRLK
ncbi:glycosyltransferase family 2 protein [Pedobacter chinensis]|uniref:glycosyltransferase family 2 protein n=1 Tax=Pedobacter chinensis TaxID=2282421 RepID=UPI00131474AC|nr:glycosyltransferase family 2 protein [Pedobacter chinensis]